MGDRSDRRRDSALSRRVRLLRPTAPSAVVNGALPLLVYVLVRPHVSSDAAALAIAGAIPVAGAVAAGVWRGGVDPIGVTAILGLALALAVTLLMGGSSLPLKLRRPVVTGVIGLACLVSVAVRRPLAVPALRLLAAVRPERAGVLTVILDRASTDHAFRRRLAVATVVVGVTFFVEAVAEAILAVSVPTLAFLAVRLAIGGAGVIVLLLYARHQARGGPRWQG